MKCDLKCPPMTPRYYCCKHCGTARKDFVNGDNKFLWSDELGFWSETGCRLMIKPKECEDFDCKKYMFPAIVFWQELKGWTLMVKSEVIEKKDV